MTCFFFFQAEDGIRDLTVTGVQTCALPISPSAAKARAIARPMPPPAPVTTTARPSRRIAGSGEADGDPAEPSERGTHGVAGLRAEQGRDRARHDELARPEREPAPAQAIGDPRERVQRIAHH